jgi:hypothetical protein
MSLESNTGSPRSQGRRKLLRGSLSAPLVLTVASPTALARTSFTACLNNSTQQPAPWNVFANEPDRWFRLTTKVYRLKVNGKSLDGVYYFDWRKNRYFNATVNDTVGIFKDWGVREEYAGMRYPLGYVDENGKVLGFGWQSNGGRYTMKSCYTSLIARA